MKILLRNIRSGKRQAAIRDLKKLTEQELGKALDEVKTAMVKSLNLVVADWEHQVKFDARKFIKPAELSVNVFPTGENAWLWELVSRTGSKPHPIFPRRARFLKFEAGQYVSKTLAKPARTVSGGGKVLNGVTVFSRGVQHPGFEPRLFEEDIAEDIKPDFVRVTDNAFRRIANAVKE